MHGIRKGLSSRYNLEFVKENNEIDDSFAGGFKGSKISDPLKRRTSLRRKQINSKDYIDQEQLSLLNSVNWLKSDLVSFTTRYELETRHNIQLMTHYGDKVFEESEEIVTIMSECDSSENEDLEDEIEYFHPKPRKIDFDVSENSSSETNTDANIRIDDKKATVKKRRTKALTDVTNKEIKKFTCDVCSKVFDKRWALNSHMLLHSGDKPYRCNYKTCTKQYADRSNLRAHQRSKKHHSWKLFCHQCTKPFSEQRYLNLHSLSACRKYLSSVNKKS